jgi:hypothetical protein
VIDVAHIPVSSILSVFAAIDAQIASLNLGGGCTRTTCTPVILTKRSRFFTNIGAGALLEEAQIPVWSVFAAIEALLASYFGGAAFTIKTCTAVILTRRSATRVGAAAVLDNTIILE